MILASNQPIDPIIPPAPSPPSKPSGGFKSGGVTRRTIRQGMRDRLRTE